jgi:hypothetical protein
VLLPFQDTTPDLRVADLPVTGASGAAATALRIDLGERQDGWFHAQGGTEGHWQIGDWQFSGRWLHWRCGPDGRLLRAVSHAGATLRTPTGLAEVLSP